MAFVDSQLPMRHTFLRMRVDGNRWDLLRRDRKSLFLLLFLVIFFLLFDALLLTIFVFRVFALLFAVFFMRIGFATGTTAAAMGHGHM